jgi:hypothetical protein
MIALRDRHLLSANIIVALCLFACSFLRPSADPSRKLSFDLSTSRTWETLNLDPDMTMTVDGPAIVTVRLPDGITISDFPSGNYSFARDSRNAAEIESVTLLSRALSITETDQLVTVAASQLGLPLTRLGSWKSEQLAYVGPDHMRQPAYLTDSQTYPTGIKVGIGIRHHEGSRWIVDIGVYFSP